MIRSNLPENGFPAAAIVLAYKGLSHAERGFRDIKSGDLDVRPIHHRRAHRVRAHVFLCMLAYYVIWHMKRDLAPMLFKDDNPAAAAAQRSSPVAKAKVSPAARRKAARKRTEDGQPVHSFRTLLQDLANLTRNSVRFGDAHPGTSEDYLVQTALTAVAAFGSFLIAQHLGASGVLATVSAGIVMGNLRLLGPSEGFGLALTASGRTFVPQFWEFAAFLANSLVFLLTRSWIEAMKRCLGM